MKIGSVLAQLSLHRETIESGVKNTEHYKTAHKLAEKDFALQMTLLTSLITHASNAGVVAGLRDFRKVCEEGLKVLQETRL